MAELDPEVIRVSREYLGQVHRGAFDDPRLQVPRRRRVRVHPQHRRNASI
jgi:predicted membrane-bound spermidine synthase